MQVKDFVLILLILFISALDFVSIQSC